MLRSCWKRLPNLRTAMLRYLNCSRRLTPGLGGGKRRNALDCGRRTSGVEAAAVSGWLVRAEQFSRLNPKNGPGEPGHYKTFGAQAKAYCYKGENLQTSYCFAATLLSVFSKFRSERGRASALAARCRRGAGLSAPRRTRWLPDPMRRKSCLMPGPMAKKEPGRRRHRQNRVWR